MRPTPRLVLVSCLLLLAAWCAPAALADDQPTAVPDVTGRSAAEATAALEADGFRAVLVDIADGTPGKVHSQVPAAGTLRAEGSEIEVRVGTALRVQTQVPDVRGKTLEQALEDVESVYVIDIELVDGPEADQGKVIDQMPKPGEPLLFRGVLRLTTVQEPSPAGVIVPSVLGKTETEARQMIEDAGLNVAVSYAQDPVADPGIVVSQEPACCGEILAGGLVSIRVNGEPPAEPQGQIPMPQVVDMTMHDASSAVLMVGLVPRVEFRVDAGAPWRCLEQDPAAGTLLPEHGEVRLIVSLPSQNPAQVRVPPLYGLSSADAIAVLGLVGLQAHVVEQYSLYTPGRVFGQSPSSGTFVGTGATITVRVARTPPGGWQPGAIQVPSVIGLAPVQAFMKLLASGLWGHEHHHVSPGSSLGRVDSQHPAAGALVGPGTGVRFYLPKATTVPNLLGSSKAHALQKLLQASLNGSANGPAFGFGGTKVVSQSVAAGTKVAEGTTISFAYKYLGGVGQLKVKVPSLIGHTKAQAASLLQGKMLNGNFVGPPLGFPPSKITSQSPAANTLVLPGSTVTAHYVYLGGPAVLKVQVPNVVGMTKAHATAALQAKGLLVHFVGPAFGLGVAKVISQNPHAGVIVNKGTTVVAHYKYQGVIQVLKVHVPNLIGMSKAQAAAALQGKGLHAQFAGPGPGFGIAKVIAQNPNAGALVPAGTSVHVKLKHGGIVLPLKVAVPHLLGKTKQQALVALQAKGLNAKFLGPQFGFGTTKVVSQSPNPGTLVNKGTLVTVKYVFSGPAGGIFLKVQVPHVIGKTKAQAKALLLAKGLQAHFLGPMVGFGTPKVISQNPHAGVLVNKGTTIVMVIKFQ